jgi:hypothetical protein
MRWCILFVVICGCGGRILGEGEGDAASMPDSGHPAQAAPDNTTNPVLDFTCPPEPLAEGMMCDMPANEQCKYFERGEWLCLGCDPTRQWARPQC